MKAFVALIMVLPALAGCFAPEAGPAPTGCALACPVEPARWADWTLPEGAEVELAFDQGHGEVQALGLAGDTWVWVVERGGTLWFEWHHDGTTLGEALPSGHSLRKGAMHADARGAWFVTHADDVLLTHWSADDRSVASEALPGITGPAWLRGVGRDGAVVRGTFDGVPGAGLWKGAWTPIGDGAVIDADIRGNAIVYVARSGFDDAPTEVRAMDAVTGTELNITVTADVRSVSADGGLAFVVDTSDGPVIWGIDDAWRTTELGPGDQPAFIPAGRVYVDQDEGDPPHVRFHSDVTNSSGAAFYLQPRTVWTVTAQGVAWVEPPSADPRFVESPNPTPFEGALFTRS